MDGCLSMEMHHHSCPGSRFPSRTLHCKVMINVIHIDCQVVSMLRWIGVYTQTVPNRQAPAERLHLKALIYSQSGTKKTPEHWLTNSKTLLDTVICHSCWGNPCTHTHTHTHTGSHSFHVTGAQWKGQSNPIKGVFVLYEASALQPTSLRW